MMNQHGHSGQGNSSPADRGSPDEDEAAGNKDPSADFRDSGNEAHASKPKDAPDNENRQTTNPLGNSLAISVSVPRQIHIKMVDASVLGQYEIWVFLASLACNFLVGLAVALVQAIENNAATVNVYIAVVVFLALVFIGFLSMALYTRRAIRKEGKEVVLETTAAKVT